MIGVRRQRFARRAAGFTMVELLVTMLLLAIVLCGLAALQVATIRNVSGSRRSSEALRLGQAVVEGYRVKSMTEIASEPQGAWHYVIDRGAQQMSNISADGTSKGPYSVQSLIEDLGGGVRLITVKVTWTDLAPGTGALAYKELNVMLSTTRFP